LATGTPTLGLGVTINTSGVNISGVATAGIVSATTLYGDGTNLTGIALSITPLNYNPAVGGLIVGSGTGIGITFNQAVKAGSGNVTLSIANAGVAGTVVENFGVGNSVSYSNGDTITITPTSSLDAKQTYHLSYPSGAFTTIGGDVSYVGTAYTFITKGGQIWVWGDNEYGQLGLNNKTSYSSPVQVPGNNWTTEISSGHGGYIAAIKTDGTLWAWGLNSYGGPLGQNNTTFYSSPVQIPGTTWKQVTTGWDSPASFNMMAVKTDNTLWAWGGNDEGELGQNNTTQYSSPIQIPGTTWKQASLSRDSAVAVKTDGTLWVWGRNQSGKLGLNEASGSWGVSNVRKSSPVQVPGTTWNNAWSGNYNSAATKTDGTLWMWGHNDSGQLGMNNKTYYSSPVQIPGTTWKKTKVVNNAANSASLKTDGTLWSWGYNSYAELGQNDRNRRSSPVQIPGTTWKSVAIQQHNTYATKTDGTLWTWGMDSVGSLGLNQSNGTKYSSPVQVGSLTDWNVVPFQSMGSNMIAHKEV